MENTQQQGQQEEEKKPTDPQAGSDQQKDLSKNEVPDSTNESTGVPGSGQRQDSN